MKVHYPPNDRTSRILWDTVEQISSVKDYILFHVSFPIFCTKDVNLKDLILFQGIHGVYIRESDLLFVSFYRSHIMPSAINVQWVVDKKG